MRLPRPGDGLRRQDRRDAWATCARLSTDSGAIRSSSATATCGSGLEIRRAPDTDKIHRPHWVEDPDWAYAGGLYHIRCDFRLLIDNLMDLARETSVHANSIGQKEIDEAVPKTKSEGDEVVTSRILDNILAPPVLARGSAR